MIIDSHFHIGYFPNYYFYNTTIENCIMHMNQIGISNCINTNFRCLCGDITGGIEEDKKVFEESQGRILSYFVFDPNNGRKCIDLMKQNYNRDIFKAIKIHPSFHSTYADDPSYEILWDYAREMKLPVMSHTWEISDTNPSQKYSYPPRFEKYIATFPDVTFICGHSGGKYDGIIECIKLMKKYPNVYADTSGDVYYNRLPEYLVKEVGSNRILYGSDAFMIDWRTQIGMILDADISLQDKENIFYNNAEKIFSL